MGLIRKILFRKKDCDRSYPTKTYKVRRYFVNTHCVKDMNVRKITKGEVYYNLTTKPIQITKVKYDELGRPSYRRSSKNKITTAINPVNKNVVSVNRLHSKDYEKIMKGKRK